MKVKELIEKLQALDKPEHEVGYMDYEYCQIVTDFEVEYSEKNNKVVLSE